MEQTDEEGEKKRVQKKKECTVAIRKKLDGQNNK